MRKKRPLERTPNRKMVRDTKLIVIASEDYYAVKQYFEFFHSTRIQFHILETLGGSSSPKHIMDRLDDYLKEYDIGQEDRLWYVGDTDHWNKPSHIKNLVEVKKLCSQKGIGFSLSNPCFDLWLLLHFADFSNENNLTCEEIGDRIRLEAGKFDKTKIYNLSIDINRVAIAIKRSKANYSGEEIPSQPQTSVHLIIEDLVNRGIISIEA